MDYQLLLEKYIRHIIECESSDYITFYDAPPPSIFTEEEFEELKRIATKIDNE